MKNIIIIFIAMVSATTITIAQPSEKAEAVVNIDPSSVVKDFFNAFREKNREKVASLLHPEVVWIQPGNNQLSGVKKSREEVMQMGKQMGERSAKTITLAEIKFLSATGNSVACLLRWKAAQPTGVVLDVENIDVYTIENGKIVNVKVYSADLEQEDKFWGR
ncbi:MAG TPA: nuclear transport factor 2 family protein [Cyclobacteriaceae bacterium]|nr:nuclear transport factor 2 family protein [Cyclobacteriaceae bacterium]